MFWPLIKALDIPLMFKIICVAVITLFKLRKLAGLTKSKETLFSILFIFLSSRIIFLPIFLKFFFK
jgi:hypothetical protein